MLPPMFGNATLYWNYKPNPQFSRSSLSSSATCVSSSVAGCSGSGWVDWSLGVLQEQQTAQTDIFGTCDLGACLINPCLNGGTCEDEDGIAVCSCAHGYSGTYCDISESFSKLPVNTTIQALEKSKQRS